MNTIYLAGGCFWGMQKFIDQFDGVTETQVGYANGPDRAPSYQDVCKSSGHAETVRITYDPAKISLIGFSAGGYLVCLWNTQKGYPSFGLPKPQACFPVYPVVSLKERIRYGAEDRQEAIRLYGCPVEEAAKTEYEIPEHVEGFPPCAIFLAAGDELVSPENSRMLAAALEAHAIPCRLEIGPEGGHGFADGSGMCMAGWTERAVKWYEGENADG